jgi:glycosyltransferase involved in cell wall biosynthesis
MSQPRYHILFAHNSYGRPSGEEHACEQLASLVQLQGHQISWFLRSSAEIQSKRDLLNAFFSGIYSVRSKRQMAHALATQKPDIVQVQNLYPFLSPSILEACQDAGVPVVMRCPNYRLFCPSGNSLSHGQVCDRCFSGKEYWCVLRNCEDDYFKSLGYALRNAAARISRRILDNVNVFIVLSDFQKQRFIERGIPDHRIAILPNMVQPCANGHPEGQSQLITFVGRASPEKGIEDFVAAARALPDLPFAVAGATDRMPHLMAASPKNLQWLGFLRQDEINSLYNRSRLVVLPSRCFEGFPNSVAQAMAARKPVVASRLGGIPEIVEDGKTGLLFESGNVKDLVEKIQRLSCDDRLCRQLGSAGHAKANVQYSPELVYRRLMGIYAQAKQLREEVGASTSLAPGN